MRLASRPRDTEALQQRLMARRKSALMASRRGDSGSHNAVISHNTSGKTPPMTKMIGQPNPRWSR